jgi:hypothetical protein
MVRREEVLFEREFWRFRSVEGRDFMDLGAGTAKLRPNRSFQGFLALRHPPRNLIAALATHNRKKEGRKFPAQTEPHPRPPTDSHSV